MQWFDAVFGTQGHVNAAQECARAGLIFLAGLALVRLVGRRVFGKWAALDITVAIMVGSSLSRAITGSVPLVGTLLASVLLMALHWLLAHATARWPLVSRLAEGRPVQLAIDGRLAEHQARRWAISAADLAEALRQSGVDHLGQTRLLVLEPSGKISVLKPPPGDGLSAPAPPPPSAGPPQGC